MRANGSAVVSLARLGAFTFGIQIVWGAILAVSLQARSAELAPGRGLDTYALIAAAGAGLATVVQVVAGMWSDARRRTAGHRREFLLWGTGISLVAVAAFYSARNLVEFAASFFVLQVALNVATSPYQAAIPDYVSPVRRGEASSWMSAWQSLGNAAGLLVAGFVKQLGVVAAILDAALLVFCTITVAHLRRLTSQPSDQRRFKVDSTFAALLVSRGVVNLGFFTMLGFLFFFVQNSLGITSNDAARMQTALLFLAFTLAAVVGAAIAGRPADRFDIRAVATAANAVILVALAALAGARTLPVAYASAALAGAAWGAFFTSDWALACALLPRGAMATAMGVWNVATAAPQVFAPALTALVLHAGNFSAQSGPRVAVLLALLEFAAGTALLWRLPATRAAAAPG